MEPTTPQQTPGMFDRFNSWLSESVTIRLLSVGFLVLILMIPNAMVGDLIRERETTSQEAVAEVSASWGNEQTIVGPYLMVPYTQTVKNTDNEEEVSYGNYNIMPEDLEINGQIMPEKRKRGIYEVVLYGSETDIKARFKLPVFLSANNGQIVFDTTDVRLCLGISDMRGISERVSFMVNGKEIECGPGLHSQDVYTAGISVQIPSSAMANGAVIEASTKLKLNGSTGLYFTPVGKETRVSLASTWPSPSFLGSFLPDDRQVSNQGFKANWKVFDLNRNFPQEWYDGSNSIIESRFGTRLIMPVDHYDLSHRSAKYAILIMALTFVVYFFIESLNHKRIHPVQYIMVGLALSVFFLLLISLSEHIGFNPAFGVAALATTLLISIYSNGVFADTRLAMFMGALLTITFGFIFTILQLEDHALLVGSIGLFGVLAGVMVWSRRIDWYGLKGR